MEADAPQPLRRVKEGAKPAGRGFGAAAVFIAGIAGGVSALLALAGFQHAGLLSAFSSPAQEAGLHSGAHLEDEIAALKTQLANLQAPQADAAAGQPAQTLLAEAQKSAAAAAAVAADAEKKAQSALDDAGLMRQALADKTDQAALSSLEQTLTQQINALDGRLKDVDALKQQFAAAQVAAHDQESRLETLKKEVAERGRETSAGMTLLVAANALKGAVDRGGSYTGELQAFEAVAPPGLALGPLRSYASTGLPAQGALSARFARVADRIAQTENSVPANAGLGEKLWAQIRALIAARPVGNVEGHTAGAVAARMETAIAAGDYGRALEEWKTLPEEAKAVSADFVRTLQARYDANAFLSRFIAGILSARTGDE